MFYPSARPDTRPRPDDVEVGVTVVGATRVRVLLDPDWGSLVCLRVAPGEEAQYLGVVTGADTDTPKLRLVTEQGWRFPTPELREAMRRSVIRLYVTWRSHGPRPFPS